MQIIGMTPDTINSICSSNASTIKEEPLDEFPAEVTPQVAPQVKEEPIFHEPVSERCVNIPRPDLTTKGGKRGRKKKLAPTSPDALENIPPQEPPRSTRSLRTTRARK